MSPRIYSLLWLIPLALLAGCQSSGRMTRGPQQAAPAQARNQPPPAQPKQMPPPGVAQATPASAEPRLPFPSAPIAPTTPPKQDNELVIRATAPAGAEPAFSPSDAHHPARPARAGAAGEQAKNPSATRGQTADDVDKVRELHELAAAKDAQVRDYVCRFRRREVIRGKPLPEDVLLFRHLKEPNSVYFKWLPGTNNEGREILFVHGKYKNQIQVQTGKGDLLTGIRAEIDPRSDRATANSRRTIDEAGLPNMLQRFGAVLTAQKQPSTLQHLGPQQRPESRTAMECVAQRVSPGQEKHLLNGGTRYWYFCADPQAPEQGLPTLVLTLDENRREVEYYAFDQFKVNVGLRPQDFDPDLLWPKR